MPFASNSYDALKGLSQYLRVFRGKTFVIKVGGEVLDNVDARRALAEQISVLWTLSIRLVIVHGGGTGIDRLCNQLNFDIQKVQGRRVTTPEVLDVVKMVLAGSLHTDWLAVLNNSNVPAVGLSGIDGKMIRAHKREPLYVGELNGQPKLIDYGLVADVDAVNPELLQTLLAKDYVPVICPLTCSADGQVLNTNADTIAAQIAVALGAEKLFFVLSVGGLLADREQPDSVISFAEMKTLDEMIATGSIAGGMLPKTAAIKLALQNHVQSVHLISGMVPDALLVEIFTNEGAGTKLVKVGDHG